MFERFTEKARRVIFFARAEAAHAASPAIETEHLLLALLREDSSLLQRYGGPHAGAEEKSVASRILRAAKIDLKRARHRIAETLNASAAPGSESGAAAAAFRRFPVTTLRQAGDSVFHLTQQPSVQVPRCGKSLIIRNEGEENRIYRVEDVRWLFDRDHDIDVLKTIELKVKLLPPEKSFVDDLPK